MKKRKVLTKTSLIIIGFISVICMIMLGAECDDMLLFFSSKIISLLILIINCKLIEKYLPSKYQ
jgi:hypothetical protein